MHLTPSHRLSERGASAILVALALLVLMGFAAIAVDGGILFSDRRQQQSAADGGALAAAQFAKTGLPTANATCATLSGAARAACRGAEEAMDVVNGTLPGRYDAAAWLGCSDPALPANFTQGSTISPCINYTRNFQEVRVVLPGTDVDTTFGRLVGLNSVNIKAFAHARLDLDQSADILPFAVGPTGAGQTQSCLFAQATAQLNILPCDASSSGNFGKLDLSQYGNTTLGTVEECGNAAPQVKMAVNIVVGSDHPLEINTATPGTVNDNTNCPIITNPVDNLPVQTGNAAQGISNGLFYGISTPNLDGRIMCIDGDPGKGQAKPLQDASTSGTNSLRTWTTLRYGISWILEPPQNQAVCALLVWWSTEPRWTPVSLPGRRGVHTLRSCLLPQYKPRRGSPRFRFSCPTPAAAQATTTSSASSLSISRPST